MTSPFDYVNDITYGKKDIIRNGENPQLAEALYQPFIVNRALSYFPDTIMYADQINQCAELDHLMQYDYLINTIRPKKRFSKWAKKQDNSDVELVQKYYKVNRRVAVDYLKVLTKQHLDEIKTIIME